VDPRHITPIRRGTGLRKRGEFAAVCGCLSILQQFSRKPPHVHALVICHHSLEHRNSILVSDGISIDFERLLADLEPVAAVDDRFESLQRRRVLRVSKSVERIIANILARIVPDGVDNFVDCTLLIVERDEGLERFLARFTGRMIANDVSQNRKCCLRRDGLPERFDSFRLNTSTRVVLDDVGKYCDRTRVMDRRNRLNSFGLNRLVRIGGDDLLQ
jgi:hypothetical protein